MIITSQTVSVISMIPFDEGTEIKSGDIVMMTECMKIMNEITSPVDGIITKIFVSCGDMTEEGDPLIEITQQELG